MLGVGPVVRLQQLGQEEDPVAFAGGEDRRFTPTHLKLYLNCLLYYLFSVTCQKWNKPSTACRPTKTCRE